MPGVSVSGTDRPFGSASDTVAVTVTDPPSATGFGVADSVTFARPSSSRIVTCTEDGLPATYPDGSVPSDTVKVSSFSPASSFVAIVPVPEVWPSAMVMEVSVPMSPDSAVFGAAVETVTGMFTALESGCDRVAVTVTEVPSTTGFGEAESDTAGSDGVPLPNAQTPSPTAFVARTRTR